MTILFLALASFIWGGVLVGGALALQHVLNFSGNGRQLLWRTAGGLMLSPFLCLPAGGVLKSMLPVLTWPTPEPVTTTAVLTAGPATEEIAGIGELATTPAATPLDLTWLVAVLGVIVVAGWVWRMMAARAAAKALANIVAVSKPAGIGAARTSLGRWTARLRLQRSPELRIVDAAMTPFSFGGFKPVVCLPEGLERRISAEALDLVIGHECLHVARGDGWWRPAERAVADLMWFNPFAWRIRAELDLARELACDEAVLEHSRLHHAYARALRDVAGLSVGLPVAAPAAAMSLAGGGRSLVLRMKRTLAHSKRRPAHAALISVVAFATIGAPLALAQVAIVAPTPPAPPAVPVAPMAAPRAPTPPAVRTDVVAPAAPAPAAVPTLRAMPAPVPPTPPAAIGEPREIQSRFAAAPEPPTPPAPPAPVTGVTPTTPVPPAPPPPPVVPTKLLGAPKAVLAPPARLTSRYGERVDPFSGKKAFHEGVDFAGAIGAPIHAPGPGSITYAGEKSGTGKVVEISVSAQQSIRFAHLQDIKVTVGDTVKAGDVIGTIGTDANSTGPHVHIEVYQQGQPVDPQKVDGLILLGRN